MKPIRFLASLACVAALAACQTLGVSMPKRVAAPVSVAAAVGEFDNHEQVRLALEGGTPLPAVRHELRAVAVKGESGAWLLWQIRLAALKATWLVHVVDGNPNPTLLVYRANLATPSGITIGATDAIDASQWAALDACALKPTSTPTGLVFAADVAACSALAPGMGESAALLPLALGVEDAALRVRLFADQARGADAWEIAHRVRWFAGWAAINGGGPRAMADNQDWHMNRDVKIGSEGGRVGVKWRDGTASGYSIELERVTYRDARPPILRLSVIEDSSGRAQSYAWANADATRIGVNLGWLQVGLDAQAAATPP